MANLFESSPVKIGKKEWRVIVYEHKYYGRCTDYEWRIPAEPRWPAGEWRSMKEWPTYNINDGMRMGCPKTLVNLYNCNKASITAALTISGIEPL